MYTITIILSSYAQISNGILPSGMTNNQYRIVPPRIITVSTLFSLTGMTTVKKTFADHTVPLVQTYTDIIINVASSMYGFTTTTS